jgi:hypothetical protein
MTLTLKKTVPGTPISENVTDLNKNDKKDLLKHELSLAQKNSINYDIKKQEMQGYEVLLPETIKLGDLSKVNKLYAMAQSFMSRVTAIEMDALDNQSRWAKLVDLLEAFIEDQRSELLVTDEFSELTNMKADALVRTKLRKKYELLRTLKVRRAEADGFVKMITAKKKDLLSVLTTLGKQVRALSVEHGTTR